VGNLLEWQKGNGRSRHRNVREGYQSNAGGVTTYEGASQQRWEQRGSMASGGEQVGVALCC
jgi:hypothetical protein